MRLIVLVLALFLGASSALADDAQASDYVSMEKLRRIKAHVEDGAMKRDAQVSTTGETASQETSPLGKAAQGLMLCLGVFFVLVYFLKRTKGPGVQAGESRLQCLERLSVGQKSHVALLSLDGREVLVGVTEGQISLLKEVQTNPIRKIRKPIPLEKVQEVKCAHE